MMKLRRTASAIGAGILLAGSMTACDDLKDNLSHVVIVEYRQVLNFVTYTLKAPVMDGPNTVAVTGLSTDPIAHPGDFTGVFVVYQICSIENDAPKAVPFEYRADRIFAYYNDNSKAHAGKLLDSAYHDVPWTFGVQNSFSAPAAFKAEVQTSPDVKTIAANPTTTLSVAWRLAILVPVAPNQEPQALLQSLPDLQYDTEGVLMKRKAPAPTVFGSRKSVKAGDLPVEC